jgi:hypothetical protein
VNVPLPIGILPDFLPISLPDNAFQSTVRENFLTVHEKRL